MFRFRALPFVLLLCLHGPAAADPGDRPARKHPNVVIIYGDDVGYADVGAYGSKKIPTPHLDRLADEGLRFTDGHCSDNGPVYIDGGYLDGCETRNLVEAFPEIAQEMKKLLEKHQHQPLRSH